jgi:hypothetical protein
MFDLDSLHPVVINLPDDSGLMRIFFERQVASILEAVREVGKFDWIKDALMPLASVLLGGAGGYFVMRRQENIQADRHERLDRLAVDRARVAVANKWLLNAASAIATFGTLKSYYADPVSEAAEYGRVFAIPAVEVFGREISGDVSELCFLLVTKDATTGVPPKWSQPTEIEALFENYNVMLRKWSEWRGLRIHINAVVGEKLQMPLGTVRLDTFLECAPRSDLLKLLYLTERLLFETDNLMINLADFMRNFGGEVCRVVDYNQVRHYEMLLTFEDTEKKLKRLRRVPDPDLNFLARELGYTDGETRSVFGAKM